MQWGGGKGGFYVGYVLASVRCTRLTALFPPVFCSSLFLPEDVKEQS